MNAVDPCAAQEEAFFFDCQGEALLGVLHHAAFDAPDAAATTGVVVIVGGPQYRAGSHRQFVHLARALAAAGHPVLRFDVRGMGDSSGAMRNFEQIDADVCAAIDTLYEQAPYLGRVVLWGLCDGASAALIYCQERHDRRVAGLCLVNPWVRSEQALARTYVKHYYLQRLSEPTFWRKLLSGGVALAALTGLVKSLRAARQTATPPMALAAFQARMAQAWKDASRPVLLLLSEQDYTAKEFLEVIRCDPVWSGALRRPALTQHTLAGADHTFSSPAQQRQVEALTCAWLQALPPLCAPRVLDSV